jgi:hypothetical protein
MKNVSRILFYLALFLLLTACGQSGLKRTPTSLPLPMVTPSPKVTSTPTIVPTPSRVPTHTARLIIETSQVPQLLETSLSIETSDALNGHTIRKITGWVYGFQDYPGGGFKNGPSYQWLDTNHLLIHPITGDITAPIPYSETFPAVISLDSGKVWLPISDEEWNYEYYLPHWSPKLQILITTQEENIFTYSSDGNLIATYKGKLDGVSPSGTKILIKGGIWIDLISGKKVNFGWDKYSLRERWHPIWSPNENRVYRCCYMYGDASTGESFGMPENAILIDGKQEKGYLNTSSGEWVGNNFLLPQMRWEDTHPITTLGFIPLFDPSAQTFHNLIDFFGLPVELNDIYLAISISPNGDYMWLRLPLHETGYLVNLKTREVQPHTSVSWSAQSKFMFIDSQVLALSSNELRALPEPPGPHQKYPISGTSHPTKEIIASIYADERAKQILYILDVETLLYQMVDLPSEFDEIYPATKIIWSPSGDRIALVTTDGSLWQLDYPNLQNLEQLTSPMPEVKDIFWSPDGTYISFVSDKDIYLVEAEVNP